MAKQSAVDSLKESIRLLEIRQAEEAKSLKDQFRVTYESLKPANLFMSSIRELTSSPEIKNSLFETIISVLSGLITRKMIVNSKSNPLMKIFGSVVQYGISSLVARNAESIRNLFSGWIDKFFRFSEDGDDDPREEVV